MSATRLAANIDGGIVVTGVWGGSPSGRLVQIGDADAAVTATGLLIDGTRSETLDQRNGRGINTYGGSGVTLVAARLSGNQDVGLGVNLPDAHVTASGLLIDGTQPAADGLFGMGIFAFWCGRFTISGFLLSGNHTSGASFHDSGGSLRDGVIRDTRPSSYRLDSGDVVTLADGLLSTGAHDLEVSRVVVTGSLRAGLLLFGASLWQQSAGCVGRGLVSRVSVERTLSSQNTLGLAIDGEVGLNETANAIFGNEEANRKTDKGLYVPPPTGGTAP